MRGKKTGGRQRGTLNKARGLGRKRERLRKQVVDTLSEAMPRLRTWLASPAAWSTDNAAASARMIDNLAKWVLPKYEAVDPHAEVAAEQAAAGRVDPVTPEDVLAALRAVPQAVPSVEAPAGGQALEAPAPTLEALPTGLARLTESESMRLQGQGIPLANGDRLLPPRVPERSARPDPATLAAADRPTIDAHAIRRETRRPEEFDANGCVQNAPPLDRSLRPMGWGPR